MSCIDLVTLCIQIHLALSTHSKSKLLVVLHFSTLTHSFFPGYWETPDTQIQWWSNLYWWVEEWTLRKEDGSPGVFCWWHVRFGRWWLSWRQSRTLPPAGSWDRTHLPRVLRQDWWGTRDFVFVVSKLIVLVSPALGQQWKQTSWHETKYNWIF